MPDLSLAASFCRSLELPNSTPCPQEDEQQHSTVESPEQDGSAPRSSHNQAAHHGKQNNAEQNKSASEQCCIYLQVNALIRA